VIHDLAYGDLCFDGYQAPSILQVPGSKDVAVELTSMSKSYNMPGWRVGFAVGNKAMIHALTRLKSYLDYGMFQPIQIASIIALNSSQECVREIVKAYRDRRDALIDGLERAGWIVDPPLATMFVWARIPEQWRSMGSLEFSKLLLTKGKVLVSPGIGFGEYGDDWVRFALVENNTGSSRRQGGSGMLYASQPKRHENDQGRTHWIWDRRYRRNRGYSGGTRISQPRSFSPPPPCRCSSPHRL
jgi:alanine-synthesizing transaminase